MTESVSNRDVRARNGPLSLILHEKRYRPVDKVFTRTRPVPVGENGLHVRTFFLSALFKNTVYKSNIRHRHILAVPKRKSHIIWGRISSLGEPAFTEEQVPAPIPIERHIGAISRKTVMFRGETRRASAAKTCGHGCAVAHSFR